MKFSPLAVLLWIALIALGYVITYPSYIGGILGAVGGMCFAMVADLMHLYHQNKEEDNND